MECKNKRFNFEMQKLFDFCVSSVLNFTDTVALSDGGSDRPSTVK